MPSSQEEDFEADSKTVGKRLDSCVAYFADITRSDAQRLIDGGFVTVDGSVVQKSFKLKAAQRVHITLPPPSPLEAEPENIPLDVVYEDDDLLVVNKPRGMVVHPAPGNYSGTLVNALLYHCKGSLSGINGVIRPGIVHRIDKDTSGLLLVAKNDCAHLSLASQIKAHSVNRYYEAVVRGVLKEPKGIIDAPIGRSTKDRKQMAVTDRNSKNAVTHYEIIKQFNKYAYVRLKLETGRTHQIRVHMAHICHPVAGDPVYGGKLSRLEESLNGQCLHARIIGFVHPRTGEYMEFTSELPEYFTDFLIKAEKV